MKKYYIFGILYLVAIVFIMNDTWLYTTPIAKLTKVETTREVEGKSTRGTAEKKYSQKMQGIILNGEKKGKTVHFSNEYTYTEMLKQKYHKGDKVFVSGSGIKGVKRDTELVMLLGILIFVLVEAAGRKGILTIITVGINIMIFAAFFLKADNTSNVVAICNKIVILFAIVTLVGLNGVNKKTWAALLSTLCVLVLIMGMFDLVIRHVQELDYSTMEYLGSIDNPDDMFHAEILLSGLGAIMDVAVAIAAALGEIVKQKPDVTFLELFKSGRKIGYDIMGTMINVLLFVFGSGLIPTFLIRMNNDIRFVTIVKLYIPCELCRFLVESIGIVWTIPVSIFITTIFMKLSVKKKEKIMLGILGLILLFSVIIVGGERGAISLIALCGNLLLLSLSIFLMAIGVPSLLVTIGASGAVSCITLFYQNGSNIKTWSAFVAVVVTMSVLFVFIYGVVWRTEIGGLNEIQAVGEDVLYYYNVNLGISMKNVMASIIILSTLGAVLDMSLTVTVSVYEVKNHKPDITITEMIKSGMHIGSEVIGTTVNTLLFAYLGESLLLFSYLKMQKYSMELLLNSKILFQNCVSMFFGAIACVLVMPISAILLAKMTWLEELE